MSTPELKFEFWGVRGTVPTPYANRLDHGGNTSCLAARLADDEYLVVDCGTGARLLGTEIAKRASGRAVRVHVLFSHYHFDHVEGLPLFLPLYDRKATIRLLGFAPEGRGLRDVLESLVTPPYFPVRLAGTPAKVEYVELHGEPFSIGDLRVSTLPLNHPDGCVAYRFERGRRGIVYATDHEHGDEAVDSALASFSRNADHLIYDATYLPAEYESLRKGWGHSTWYAAVATARAAGVRNLVLFHHHPEHTDQELGEVLRVARKEFANTFIAREGMEIPL
jgi:phosphoribosyl 1,2-cyclic phosphodiesterase